MFQNCLTFQEFTVIIFKAKKLKKGKEKKEGFYIQWSFKLNEMQGLSHSWESLRNKHFPQWNFFLFSRITMSVSKLWIEMEVFKS